MFRAIVNSYENGYTSQDEVENILWTYLTTQYPNLIEAINAGQGIDTVDDLAIIVAMLKMSQANGNNAALSHVDLDALEAEIRYLQAQFKEELSAEDQAFVLELMNDVMERTQNLASKATYSQYEVTDESFYVSLGDSNVNGYGLEGYVENLKNGLGQAVDGAAPVELAKLLYGEDWQDHFAQLAQGALRSEDMLWILGVDGVNDDAYTETEIAGNLLYPNDIEKTREAYIDAIKKADLISLAVGGGNVTTFVGRQVDLVLQGKETVEMDWAKIGVESDAMNELNALLDVLVPVIDKLGLANAYLPEGMEGVANPAAFARVLAESLLYGYASYNYYYPQVLAKINEINPDAQLLILGMFNPVDDWMLTMPIDGKETIVPIGGIVSNLMESANLQNLAYAVQTPNTTFVDISANITFLDEKIADGFEPTFADYYKEILQGNGKQVHASVAGHAYMTEQMYAALQENYLDNRVDVALEYFLPLVEKYYDDAYAYSYRYALENGYIDMVSNKIDALIAQIEAIDLNAVEMTDDFRADAEALKAEIVDTLNAAKALLLEADVLDEASLNALLALLNEAGEDMLALAAVLEQAGVDVNELVIIPALQAAHDELVNVVIPAVIDKLQAAVKAGTEWLMAKVQEAFDAMVESLVETVKECAPKAADWVYNWLYNNPDKVIAFFNEYGDDMVVFVDEYKEEIAVVVGYILVTYGEDMATYVVENADEILVTLVEWFDVHGENTWALIDVYLNELGVYDAVDKNVQALVKELKTVLEQANADVTAKIEAVIAQLAAAIDGKLNDAYVDATTDHYVVNENSYYVALGDADAYGVAAELLAQELKLADDSANLTEKDMTATELLANIDAYAADIAKADLVTMGFGANTFTNFAVEQLSSVLMGKAAEEMDWVALVGEDGAAYVAEKLDELYATFAQAGLDQNAYFNLDMAQLMTMVIESYAYSYVDHMIAYVQAVEAVHAINPDAQVVLVGMYNPMDGVVIQIGEDELNIGSYLDYLVDAANAYALGYAMIVPETIYVDAPAVETSAAAGTVSALAFVMNLLTSEDATAEYEPTEVGYEYIKTEIYNALNVTFDLPDEPEIVADGDVNGDGKVTIHDAVMLYYHVNGKIVLDNDALARGNVATESEGATIHDAVMVYYFVNGKITSF